MLHVIELDELVFIGVPDFYDWPAKSIFCASYNRKASQ